MNAKDEAKFTMFRSIEQHLDTHSSIVAGIPALLTAFNAFKSVIAAIANTEQLTTINLSGIAVDKSNAKLALAQIAADVAGLLGAYAAAISNPTLEAEVNYPVSRLKRTRDEQLVPVCQIIHDRAVEHQTALVDYGIKAPTIAALQTAINDYAAKTPNPRAALGNRKTQNAQRTELLRRGDAILKKQIDKLVQTLRTTEPEVHATYFNLREIPDAPSTVTQLKGTITDASTGAPLKGATITIVELGKTAVSTSTGKYHFKPVPHGNYTIKTAKEGYEPFEQDEIEVKLGDIRHLDMSLVSN